MILTKKEAIECTTYETMSAPGFDGGVKQLVLMGDLDASRSELAALREELYAAKESRDAEMLEAIRLQARLADSEQRNSVMREQLTKAAGLLEEGQRLARNNGSSLWEVVNEFLHEIKPTESGESE